jgi:hypothetical protein
MKVAILGIGGAGSWVSVLLATSKLKRGDTLTLIDGDRLSEDNLLRVPFPKGDVGVLKVLAAKNFLSQLTDCEIQVVSSRFPCDETEFILPEQDFVFDCSDNTPTKRALANWLPRHIPLIRVGADGFDLMVDSRRAVYWGEQDGYNVVSHAEIVARAAALAVFIAMGDSPKREILVQEDMRDAVIEVGGKK